MPQMQELNYTGTLINDVTLPCFQNVSTHSKEQIRAVEEPKAVFKSSGFQFHHSNLSATVPKKLDHFKNRKHNLTSSFWYSLYSSWFKWRFTTSIFYFFVQRSSFLVLLLEWVYDEIWTQALSGVNRLSALRRWRHQSLFTKR